MQEYKLLYISVYKLGIFEIFSKTEVGGQLTYEYIYCKKHTSETAIKSAAWDSSDLNKDERTVPLGPVDRVIDVMIKKKKKW